MSLNEVSSIAGADQLTKGEFPCPFNLTSFMRRQKSLLLLLSQAKKQCQVMLAAY